MVYRIDMASLEHIIEHVLSPSMVGDIDVIILNIKNRKNANKMVIVKNFNKHLDIHIANYSEQ